MFLPESTQTFVAQCTAWASRPGAPESGSLLGTGFELPAHLQNENYCSLYSDVLERLTFFTGRYIYFYYNCSFCSIYFSRYYVVCGVYCLISVYILCLSFRNMSAGWLYRELGGAFVQHVVERKKKIIK